MKPVVARTLRLGLTGLILMMLVLFARKVNWHDIWRTMQSASLPILHGAALINLASIVVKGIRWWVFLRPIGAPSLPLALRATFAGAGLNNVLVANGGEAARVVFIARAAHVPSAKVLATLGTRTEDIDGRLAEILRRLDELERGTDDTSGPRRVAGSR